jgi:DNA-binding SARP family transcriptional activator/DNA-binding CsgD family transcriptional regulator
MEFVLLGRLEVREGGLTVPLRSGKELSLLGLLLLHANEPVSVERIVDGLWGRHAPASAAKLVQGYVSSLRRRLGRDRVLTRAPGYAVCAEEGELDALRFQRLVSEARDAAPAEAARLLRAALTLWRGPALANVRLEDPSETGVERLNEQRLAAQIARIDADLALGRHNELIGELEALCSAHPLTERLRGHLMLALYRAGRQADALHVYRETRRVLADEVGLEPGPDLKALERRILNQDPSLELDPWRARVEELELPGPLRVESPFPFVGRVRELTVLRKLLPTAPGDGRRIVLLEGEAGCGKTRVVRRFARDAASAGALVLYGACDPEVRTPYGPIAEALAPLLTPDGADGPGDERPLARLLPELAASPDPNTERHRLHIAVADLLAQAGRRTPVLVVLEDGHWADTPTLLLLRHLARAAADARIMVLATFRDTEAEVRGELADALVDLRRAGDAVRLHLSGLRVEDVADFLAASTPRGTASPGLAVALRELTGGNAFLLCEVWRTLVDTGAVELDGARLRLARPLEEIASPQSVREVVGRRLAALPQETRDLLELAAVVGPEFGLELLREVAPEEIAGLDALEPAERAGVIEPIPPGLVHRFTHELVRRALYDRLASMRRAQLHLRIAEALERRGDSASDRGVADLAHHFAEAAILGQRDRAVDYNLRAALLATESFAFKEAAARLETALAIGLGDERRRAETLLDLGTASFRMGELPRSIESYRGAAQLAREIDDAELLARAAIGLEEACRRGLVVDDELVEVLEEASEAVGAGDTRLRVQVLAALARAFAFRGDAERGSVVGANAVAMARRLGDRRSLALALFSSYWARGGMSPERVAKLLDEAQDLAGEAGDLEIGAQAMMFAVSALAAVGDIPAARTREARGLETAERLRQPYVLHAMEQLGSALSLLEGSLADAEAAAERAHDWGGLLTGPPAHAAYGIQMFGIRREQGRLEELAPVARVLAVGNAGGTLWRPALCALLAELGLEDMVEPELEQVRRDGLDGLRRGLWLGSLTYLTDACSAIGDREVAALVYPELAAYEGGNIVIGYSVAFYGAADRYLGMLAATLSDRERAERHFAAAHELNRRIGARTWLARGCYEHGRMLVTAGEHARAEALLGEASALAEEIGLASLLARIRALRLAAEPVRRANGELSPREAEVLRLVARGRSNRAIGAALSISEHTVANHVRSILRKTGAANRTDAASWAHRVGLLEFDP